MRIQLSVVIDELPSPSRAAGGGGDAASLHAAPAGAEKRALARRLAAGEESAFDEVVERYAPLVSRLAYRLLGWSEAAADVDDVVQDVFVSVLRHARSFDQRSRLSTWIVSITLNQCRALRRRWSARLRAMAAVFARARSQRPAHPAADEVMMREDESQRIRLAVRRLRPADREVIVLHYLEHAGIAEISTILGQSRNAVEVRLHRARTRLRKLLEARSDGLVK